MSESLAQVAGIDVAKDHLDIHLHPSGATRRVSNTKAGHKALLGWLARQRIERIVFEATGPYHRCFERAFSRRVALRQDQSAPGSPLCRGDRSAREDRPG